MNKLQAERVARIRTAILNHADYDQARLVANDIIERAHDRFNEHHTTFATSMLARALVVHAMLDVAASWLTDVSHVPMPDAHAAVLDMVLNRPPEITSVAWREEQ